MFELFSRVIYEWYKVKIMTHLVYFPVLFMAAVHYNSPVITSCHTIPSPLSPLLPPLLLLLLLLLHFLHCLLLFLIFSSPVSSFLLSFITAYPPPSSHLFFLPIFHSSSSFSSSCGCSVYTSFSSFFCVLFFLPPFLCFINVFLSYFNTDFFLFLLLLFLLLFLLPPR